MKCLVIYNQRCGKRDIVKRLDVILSTLKSRFDVVDKKASFYDGETRQMAQEACGKYDAIVVAGGDGTLHEVVCGISAQKIRPKIGIVPSGTINDLSKSLKIPKNLQKSLKIITDGKTIAHDVMKINQEYSIYASAVGLLTDISYKVSSKPKSKFGKLAYYFSIPKYMFGHDAFDCKITTNMDKFDKKLSLLLVLNSKSVAGRKVDNSNNPSDGIVKIVAFENKGQKIKLGGILKIVEFFGFGIHKKSKNYQIIESSKFNLKFKNEINLNVDGEKIVGDEFDFEVLKEHIEIYRP